jgi:hypothetical protein
MLGLGDLRELPGDAQRKLDELLNLDWEQKSRDKVDETTRAVMGGLSVEELRAIFRGDPPTKGPILAINYIPSPFYFTSVHVTISAAQHGSPTPSAWDG